MVESERKRKGQSIMASKKKTKNGSRNELADGTVFFN